MFRLKTIFGGKLRRRFFDNQAVELFLQCAALNRMIQLGKPGSKTSYRITAKNLARLGIIELNVSSCEVEKWVSGKYGKEWH